jgi:dTDP-4-amino-4,6-dideoxygalactose transaminase
LDAQRSLIPYHRPFVEYNGSHILSNGLKVEFLEGLIKDLYDVEYVIACSSATQGLLIALQGLKIPLPKSRLLHTPAFAWYSSEWAIKTANFSLNYKDISRNTWLMRQDNIEWALPIHTFGNIVEYDADLLIYDGAHALGSKIRDFGLATVFSLAPTKLVTACEGGIIVTNHEYLALQYKKLRDKISRMSEPNADYGIMTLNSLDTILEWKRSLYNYYKKHLPGIFQEIPHNSNYNTIGMLTDLVMPPHIEFKKYYEPLDLSLPNTKYVYNKIVCLPSWYGVDYEKITNDILEYNEGLKSGRVRTFTVS